MAASEYDIFLSHAWADGELPQQIAAASGAGQTVVFLQLDSSSWLYRHVRRVDPRMSGAAGRKWFQGLKLPDPTQTS